MARAIGAFLRSYRQLTGMTQMELAEALGINQATVSRLEKSTKLPKKSMVPRLMQFLRQPFHTVDSVLNFMETSVAEVMLIDQTWTVFAGNRYSCEVYGADDIAGADLAVEQTKEFTDLRRFYEEIGGFEGTILAVNFDSVPSYSIIFDRIRYFSGLLLPVWHEQREEWWIATNMIPTVKPQAPSWEVVGIYELLQTMSTICPTTWTVARRVDQMEERVTSQGR